MYKNKYIIIMANHNIQSSTQTDFPDIMGDNTMIMEKKILQVDYQIQIR